MVTTAQQPDTQTTLESNPVDPSRLRTIGALLRGRFTQYEQDRRMAELQWTRNAWQYLGIYDEEVRRYMDPNRSQAYPKVTRAKVVSMISRLMNLLFPTDDKNWSVGASPVPVLSVKDTQDIINKLFPPVPLGADMQQPGDATGMPAPSSPPPAGPLTPEENAKIEAAIRDFAKDRARAMELWIQDQLAELGGDKGCGYVDLCRAVIESGVKYGAGVLKGPYVREAESRTWERDAQGNVTAVAKKVHVPYYEFVSIWDYYPDMSARTREQSEGSFERVVMTRHKLLKLKERPDFFSAQIDEAVRANSTGNYIRRAFETELLSEGPQVNATNGMSSKNKYEIYVWNGELSGKDLAAAGVTVPDEYIAQSVRAQVWIIGDIVIKAQIDPWVRLPGGENVKMYHEFIFEENETFILGNGLPQIMRDSQMGICAAVRMMLDNASVQRNIEVNLKLMAANQDVSSINADKIWYRDDENPTTMTMPAVRPIDFPMHVTELNAIVQLFQGFADQETFVNAATGGDMQRGPSEPFRTAAGASMLRGDAALPFKDVVRNFDKFTVSVIHSLLVFNKNFNPDDSREGDFQPIARGATSLIAKEVLGIQIDTLASTLTPEEKQYLKPIALLRARVRVRDMDIEDLVMNDDEAAAVDAQNAQQATQQQQNTQDLANAQVRTLLSNALKNISQAGKNATGTQTQVADVLLRAMDQGVDPDKLIQGDPNAGATPTAGPGPDQQPPTAGAQPAGPVAGSPDGQSGNAGGGGTPTIASALPV